MGSYEFRLGDSFNNLSKGTHSFVDYETLRYNFKPESIANKSGTLWRAAGTKHEDDKVKTYAELEGGGATHRFKGFFNPRKDGINECVVIIQDGQAILQRLSGFASVQLYKDSKDSKEFPATRPLPLPESLKRKYEGTDDRADKARPMVSSQLTNTNGISSQEDSSDDSDSSGDGDDDALPVSFSLKYPTLALKLFPIFF
jgi:hypothetical protein